MNTRNLRFPRGISQSENFGGSAYSDFNVVNFFESVIRESEQYKDVENITKRLIQLAESQSASIYYQHSENREPPSFTKHIQPR